MSSGAIDSHLASPRPLLLGLDGSPLLTYRQCLTRADRLAADLVRHGVDEGAVVMAAVPPGPGFVAAVVACWRLGAVLAPAAAQAPAPERARALAATRPRVLLTGDPIVVERCPATTPAEPAPASGDALLLLTSGSTALPKAVILTRANLEAGVAAVVRTFDLDETDRTLALLPWTHGHGLIGVLLATLSTGGALHLGAAGSPTAALESIGRWPVTWISVVPPLLALLTEEGPRHPVQDRLRFVRTASATLPVALGQRAEAVFGCPVAQAYGMTETSHQAAANPPHLDGRRLGTVGLATGTEWRLAGEELEGGRLLEVRGAGVFRAYAGEPDVTAAALTTDGWYRTLDVGAVDPDGHVRLLGRRSELINRGGTKVAPAEVEQAALEHPDVIACLAVAVPHPLVGEEVGLLAVPRPGVTLRPADLRRHCADRLAETKVPALVRVVDELPSLASGKPDRRRAAGLFTPGPRSPAR